MVHAWCFASEFGVPALVDAVTATDTWHRRDSFETWRKLTELRDEIKRLK
jgi:hypothetical protein